MLIFTVVLSNDTIQVPVSSDLTNLLTLQEVFDLIKAGIENMLLEKGDMDSSILEIKESDNYLDLSESFSKVYSY